MKQNNINILIGGDVVPTKFNDNMFKLGKIDNIIDEKIQSLINNSDFFCFNLETPLIKKINPIDKNGPALYADDKTIKGIKIMNPNLLFLSNNHILDQNQNGLENTKKVLEENNISYMGIGKNINDARKPYIHSFGDYKVGFYNCTEHEFSSATKTSPGANVFDPRYTFEDITKLKKECNNVIVIYHGGKEQCRYPSPELRKNCHLFVENGAEIVICQHSHCVGCTENYKDKTIIYGQGNFIFKKHDNEFWNNGLLINLIINTSTEKIDINYNPIFSTEHGICSGTEDEKTKLINDFQERSNNLLKNNFIENKYNDISNEMYENFVAAFLGRKMIFRILNKITHGKIYRNYYNKQSLLIILNFIQCETHRELLINSLENKIREGKDKNE